MRHIRLANYKFKPGTVDTSIRKAQRELLPVLRNQPGCVSYEVVKTGPDEAISLSTWETRKQAEAASQTLAAWVQANVADMIVAVETRIGELAFSMDEIRKGMEVKSADGITLGKITEIWVGADPVDSSTPSDEDTSSRLEVREAHQHGSPLYIPYSAIAGVSDRWVTLNVDAATAHTRPWHYRPTWLPPKPAEDPSGIFGAAQIRR